MTTNTNTRMTTAQVAGLVLGHLTEHDLPEPCSLFLEVGAHGMPEIRVQLAGGRSLGEVAGTLLAWANTFTTVTVRVWLPPHRESVHLDVGTTLSCPAGHAAVTVYAGVDYQPAVFGPLEPNERRPVTLGQLAIWAASAAGVAA